jgi:hypothetical protein
MPQVFRFLAGVYPCRVLVEDNTFEDVLEGLWAAYLTQMMKH